MKALYRHKKSGDPSSSQRDYAATGRAGIFAIETGEGGVHLQFTIDDLQFELRLPRYFRVWEKPNFFIED